MIFFNEVGDEVGGLIYEGHQQDSSYQAFGHLSFDQWKQNQVVAVQYQDNGEARGAGLRVWDRPTEVPLEAQFALAAEMLAAPAGRVRDSLNAARLQVREQVQGTPRLFVGSQNRKALLELRDTEGRVRIEMAVDSMGTAQLTWGLSLICGGKWSPPHTRLQSSGDHGGHSAEAPPLWTVA
jgi:hypothetical protein